MCMVLDVISGHQMDKNGPDLVHSYLLLDLNFLQKFLESVVKI